MGDELIIHGPVPRPADPRQLRARIARYVAVIVAVLLLNSWTFARGWHLKTSSLVLPIGLAVYLVGLELITAYRGRRAFSIEVSADGLTITPDDPSRPCAKHARHQIRRVQLVHPSGKRRDPHVSTLQLVLHRARGFPWRFNAHTVFLLNGPADSLREIGVRIRQVLNLPY